MEVPLLSSYDLFKLGNVPKSVMMFMHGDLNNMYMCINSSDVEGDGARLH